MDGKQRLAVFFDRSVCIAIETVHVVRGDDGPRELGACYYMMPDEADNLAAELTYAADQARGRRKVHGDDLVDEEDNSDE